VKKRRKTSKRALLVRKVNQLLMEDPYFQGPGIMTDMIPFLQQTIGTTLFARARSYKLDKLYKAMLRRKRERSHENLER